MQMVVLQPEDFDFERVDCAFLLEFDRVDCAFLLKPERLVSRRSSISLESKSTLLTIESLSTPCIGPVAHGRWAGFILPSNFHCYC
jgi:hypothetical protein